MKTRHGFVSNSSSSSFIVAFPEHPDTEKDMKEMLFPGEEEFENLYYDEKWSPIKSWPTETVATIVYRDFSNQLYHKKNRKDLIDIAYSGYLDGQPDYDGGETRNMSRQEKNQFWSEYRKKCREYAREVVEQFLEDKEDHTIAVFRYSDNDGKLFTAMEHGGTFKNVPHLRISNH